MKSQLRISGYSSYGRPRGTQQAGAKTSAAQRGRPQLLQILGERAQFAPSSFQRIPLPQHDPATLTQNHVDQYAVVLRAKSKDGWDFARRADEYDGAVARLH